MNVCGFALESKRNAVGVAQNIGCVAVAFCVCAGRIGHIAVFVISENRSLCKAVILCRIQLSAGRNKRDTACACDFRSVVIGTCYVEHILRLDAFIVNVAKL